MFVFTHFPCDDGKLAGLVWLSRFPNSTINNWIHGDSQMIKMLQFDSSEKIVFLDVCPNILYLNPNNNYLIIDHHENAINSIKAHQSSNIELFVDTKYSGCMLTWMYCYGNKPFPKIINHIGKKDIWDFSDHDTEPYCIGFNEVIINEVIINEVITKLLFDDTNDLHNIFIENGKKLINKYIQEAAQIFKNYKVEDNIIEITLHSHNNVLYKYLIEYAQLNFPDYDILRIGYPSIHIDGIYNYSLRSLKDHIRVDSIARQYGGNGHPKAAGYNIILTL